MSKAKSEAARWAMESNPLTAACGFGRSPARPRCQGPGGANDRATRIRPLDPTKPSHPSSRRSGLGRRLDRLFGDQDHLRDLDQLAAFVHGQLLELAERPRFVQGGPLHEDPFGPLDDL